MRECIAANELKYIFYQEIETIEKSDDLTLVRTEQKIMINDNDNIGDYDGKYRPALQIKVANEQSKIVDLEEDENLSYRKLQSFKRLFNISNVESSVSSIDDLAKEWDNIIFSDDETHVIDALRIIEPKIESLAFLSDDYQHLRFDRNRIIRGDEVRVPYVKLSGVEGRTPLHSMGDGVFRLLQIILNSFKPLLWGFTFVLCLITIKILRLWKQLLKLHLTLQKRFNVILLLKTTPNTPILEAYQSSLLLTYRSYREIPLYLTTLL